MRKILFLVLAGWCFTGYAQKTFPVNDVADSRPSTYAFINATLYKDYQTKLESATLVIREGRVIAAGVGVAIPKGAQTIDLQGRFIYPSFVDPYTSYGLPEVKSGRGFSPQYDSKRDGAYGWNEAIKSDYKASDEFKTDAKAAKTLRKNGFGAVVSFRPDGVVRGTSVVASLGDDPVQNMMINQRASAHLSFNKGTSRQLYPNSIMGMVALLRQTYLDAEWYARSGNKELTNMSLSTFTSIQDLPQVFEANGGKLRVLLADNLGDEFGKQYVIKGNGDEYQRINEIKATGASLIIPVTFPKAYDVDDPIDALEVSYADLKNWELAPGNPAALSRAGIEFALTADGLKDVQDYLANVRKAIESGLTETQALKAMTYTPARLVRMQNEIGTLNEGSRANFIITSSNVFEKDAEIFENWIHGKKYLIKEKDEADLVGTYDLSVGDQMYSLKVSGEPGKAKGKIEINDSTKLDVEIKVDGQSLSMSFTEKDAAGPIRLSGWISGKDLKGTGRLVDASWANWTATYKGANDEKEKEEKDETEDESSKEVGSLVYPFAAYGWTERPVPQTILFKNATVWTMEGAGKLDNADVLIQNGKIAQVGQNLSASGAREIDATGKHITPGIIDEHSHAALSGVNESSHSIVSEVRMSDAIDSEDITIYRQLAGGVTTAQLLHGSANPVGGQSTIIKFRWGLSPNELQVAGSDKYIKFALGENVKQSNRSPEWNERFPQTRMGVEQVFVDGFTRAKEYDAIWRAYNALGKKEKPAAMVPRRDLQLEALAEILNKDRFISCHSYVQSEINMLMKVADSFNFNVNTFTHILEGYKVADKMAAHGVGGSTFSDWWAYKYEVKDAIPYNAVLMTQAGVTVAINSDDGEMARRLNQEAAKSIKYGGMDEVEALKMVTLNPAKLLHLDDQMGSLKVGKDADVVLWNEHPLSIYAKSEMTLVDGIAYYDAAKDAEMRKAIELERARIINKMKAAKKGGAKTEKYKPKERHEWDCEEFVDDYETLND